MRLSCYSIVILICVVLSSTGCESASDSTEDSLIDLQPLNSTVNARGDNETIQFTEYGIELYGRFRFESEGELFAVYDEEMNEVIATGCVTTCIRPTYTIGYYDGGATIDDTGAVIPKVFFVLTKEGNVSFYLPSNDGKFCGIQIDGNVHCL